MMAEIFSLHPAAHSGTRIESLFLILLFPASCDGTALSRFTGGELCVRFFFCTRATDRGMDWSFDSAAVPATGVGVSAVSFTGVGVAAVLITRVGETVVLITGIGVGSLLGIE